MRQLDDGFRMMAILAQCVFERLGAVHEEPPKCAVLFASNPVATTSPANKDGRRCEAARWRLVELHDHHPSKLEWYAPQPCRLRDCRSKVGGAGSLVTWLEMLSACVDVQHSVLLRLFAVDIGLTKAAATLELMFAASALRVTSLVSASIRVDRASFIGRSRNKLTVLAAAPSLSFQQSTCQLRILIRTFLCEGVFDAAPYER